jgi:hypothetical protein
MHGLPQQRPFPIIIPIGSHRSVTMKLAGYFFAGNGNSSVEIHRGDLHMHDIKKLENMGGELQMQRNCMQRICTSGWQDQGFGKFLKFTQQPLHDSVPGTPRCPGPGPGRVGLTWQSRLFFRGAHGLVLMLLITSTPPDSN